MANGKLLDLLNAIRDLFEGLGSSTSTDDVPLVGEIKTPSFRSGRRTSRRRGKEHVKGKIGDLTLEADGQDAPEMLQSTSNTLTNAYARRKGIDFVVGTLQKLRDKELGVKRGTEGEDPEDVDDQTPPEDEVDFIDDFNSKFKMPSLTRLPFLLGHILACLPKGYFVPMLLHLLSMFGALCFSKVRALYLDGKRHAANIQVVVEGGWGQGKAKLEDLYHILFERVIESDRAKLLEENDESTKKSRPHRIIQTAGIGLTRAKMFDVLADNQNLHIFIFESEIKALVNSLRGTCGITTDHLRKAFENGLVYQNNKLSNSKSGNYPIYLNYTFTGTMGDTGQFIKKELEGGTLSRIAWTSIPEAGKTLENLQMDAAEVKQFRDKIDDWRKLYCYTTDSKGNDTPCKETDIDLSYLFPALKRFLDEQYDQSVKENNPARRNVRARSACIAFHCAIVLHQLYDQPMTAEDKQEVINATIYLANYVIERFLFKFQDEQNKAYWQRRAAEKVKKDSPEAAPSVTPSPSKKPGPADAPRLKQEHDAGAGWDKIGEKYGCSGTWIKKLVRKYEERLKRRSGGSESK